MTVFRYSITYLMLLFAALLVDHYLPRCGSDAADGQSLAFRRAPAARRRRRR